MRLIVFANNWVGWQAVAWLRAQGEEIAALVVHPPERARWRDEIVRAAGTPPERVFPATDLRGDALAAALEGLDADLGVSALFGYLLPPRIARAPRGGCVNLHPGYLPFNRGAHPNVWSIVERTPAGVTLHYIDDGVDSGDVVAQRLVDVEPVDTGATLYRKLEAASLALLAEAWPAVRAGTAVRLPQRLDGGTLHRTRDLGCIDEIDPDAVVRAGDLIDLLRARTFPPYPGAWVRAGGRKVHLRLELEYGD